MVETSVNDFATLLADPRLTAIIKHSIPYPGCRLALVADQLHVGDIDGRFTLDDTHLRPGLAGGALVLLNHVHARHDQLLLLWVHAVNCALSAFVIAAQNLHSIAPLDLHRNLLIRSSR
jgi:hypothetical protein